MGSIFIIIQYIKKSILLLSCIDNFGGGMLSIFGPNPPENRISVQHIKRSTRYNVDAS